MKRIFTPILLLVMLTLSMHPVITLHYCQGNLHSFSVVATGESNACCVSSNVNESGSLNAVSANVTELSEKCCSFEKLEIVTDNFLLERTNTTVQESFSSLDVWAVVNYLVNLYAPQILAKGNNLTPLTGLFKTALKFLSFTCVYRL